MARGGLRRTDEAGRRGTDGTYHRAMLLALEVGNTDLKVGLVEAGGLCLARARSSPGVTADELESVLHRLLSAEGRGLAEIDGLAIATVVPAYERAAVGLGERHGVPLFVARAAAMPFAVRVAHPAAVGIDRLLNALAVQRLYGTPAIVVDLGTATTFDVVDADGAYVGGAIAAGPRLSVEALALGTAQLPAVTLEMPERAIGRDTAEAMRSGAVLGHVGVVRELLARMTAELADEGVPRRLVTVLTGGFSHAPWASVLPASTRSTPS